MNFPLELLNFQNTRKLTLNSALFNWNLVLIRSRGNDAETPAMPARAPLPTYNVIYVWLLRKTLQSLLSKNNLSSTIEIYLAQCQFIVSRYSAHFRWLCGQNRLWCEPKSKFNSDIFAGIPRSKFHQKSTKTSSKDSWTYSTLFSLVAKNVAKTIKMSLKSWNYPERDMIKSENAHFFGIHKRVLKLPSGLGKNYSKPTQDKQKMQIY